mgnify:CR=1 FL=1
MVLVNFLLDLKGIVLDQVFRVLPIEMAKRAPKTGPKTGSDHIFSINSYYHETARTYGPYEIFLKFPDSLHFHRFR